MKHPRHGINSVFYDFVFVAVSVCSFGFCFVLLLLLFRLVSLFSFVLLKSKKLCKLRYPM